MVMMSTSGNLEVDVATNDDYITKAFIADGDIQHAQTRRKLIFNNSGFISIDCGESEDYTDPSSGIFYQTDAEFIGTGKNKPISSESMTLAPYDRRSKNLRSFDEGIKNCYTLPKPSQGKDDKYLLRGSFMYGNYDGKNEIPKFDLYLGVNFWVTVELEKVLSYFYEEIIFVPATDLIYVCLVNTGSGIPFISALELRLLDNPIYAELGPSLQTAHRYDVGSNQSVRYKDDVYDRIWNTGGFDGYYPIKIQDQESIDTQNSATADKPPEKVLSTAIKAQSAGDAIDYKWNPTDPNSDSYVYLHFAEIEVLPNGTQRKLYISLNGEPYPGEQPIKLEYLKATTVTTSKWPIKGAQLSFSISTGAGSDLPPILNGLEILQAKSLLLLPTNQEDVDAIMNIKKNVTAEKKDWQGDPCLPINYTWQGLHCSDENPPRIISLNLSSSGLSGEILPVFFNFKSIQSLDLSSNNLSGPLPGFLEQLPFLNMLNLSGNNLTGFIPQALQQKVKDKTLLLRVDKNPNLCLTDSCEKTVVFCNASMDENPKVCQTDSRKKKTTDLIPVLVPIVSALILLLLGGLAIFWTLKRKKRGEMVVVEAGKEGSVKSKTRKFTFSEIVSITGNFEIVIGRGGSGTVYHGRLKDGTQVAVKMLSPSSTQTKEFHTEVQLLMRIHHRNLATLIGYCDEGTNMALISEYMANGNVKQHLSGIIICCYNAQP
ncbi:unnamed protein product [Ilex paraguariensis]|uniref:non-specific serine/threonine protein kinase n=1 Tax=Ilex paraguariensis TaxID=185542 RepID=A0ABC8U470_9AQUA